MKKINLSYKENYRAPVVFLNIFDLYLEEKKEVLDNDILKEFTKNISEVGKII